MADHPISRFPVPELSDLPDDIRELIETVQEKSGFVPNVFLALSNRPDEFRAFFAMHDALMDKSDGLSKAEREMIVVATSATNQCLYCVVAHGAILRIRAKNPLIADQLANNPWKADLSDRERAMIDFSLRVAGDSATISDADIDDMRTKGFTTDEIWDIGAIAAFFAMSNRLANLTSMRPNDEFYSMGRYCTSGERSGARGQSRGPVNACHGRVGIAFAAHGSHCLVAFLTLSLASSARSCTARTIATARRQTAHELGADTPQAEWYVKRAPASEDTNDEATRILRTHQLAQMIRGQAQASVAPERARCRRKVSRCCGPAGRARRGGRHR